jgi:hypothetical protein
MAVGQGPNVGCSAKGKKMYYRLPSSNDITDEVKSFRKPKNVRRCNTGKQLNIQSLFKQKYEIFTSYFVSSPLV